MATSIREYAILYVGGKPVGGSSAVVAGGNVVLATAPHALGGPEHTGLLPIERISTTDLDPTHFLAADGLGQAAFRAIEESDVVGLVDDLATAARYEVLMATGLADPPDPVSSSDGLDWLYGVAL